MALLRHGSFTDPVPLTVCAVLEGHNAVRPCEGEAAVSVSMNGLSQMSVCTLLLNHDPSYPTRIRPRSFAHSAATVVSVVR